MKRKARKKKMTKTTEFTCPKCSEDVFIDEVDATVEDMVAHIKMTCCCCGAEWTDIFRLTYIGYSMGHEVWDKNGEKIV
jgi:transcription elongation factor Elf1